LARGMSINSIHRPPPSEHVSLRRHRPRLSLRVRCAARFRFSSRPFVLGIAYALRGVLIPCSSPSCSPTRSTHSSTGSKHARAANACGAYRHARNRGLHHPHSRLRDPDVHRRAPAGSSAELPSELKSLQERAEPWLWQNFHFSSRTRWASSEATCATSCRRSFPSRERRQRRLFGTLSYVAVILSGLIVPVFALYLLIDFDRIVESTGQLVPRRWYRQVASVARQIHRTLGGYVRGQLTANIVLGALYATGLRMAHVRLAVPIGVLTGCWPSCRTSALASGLTLAVSMAMLDWQGPGRLVAVLAVMLGVQALDGLVVTPRIVGRSVGLAPLEVLLTMMAAGTLFGFLGVLLAVPLGAVVKILAQRVVRAYLAVGLLRARMRCVRGDDLPRMKAIGATDDRSSSKRSARRVS
jgi:predicted PurR-regulated permease PerM